MNVNMSVCKVAVVLSVFDYTGIFSTEFRKKNCNVIVNENSSSGSRVVLWVRTDGQTRDEDNRRFFAILRKSV